MESSIQENCRSTISRGTCTCVTSRGESRVSSNQGSSTQFRRLGRIDARDWTRERRVISRRHKMRAAGVEVTAGNEDKGSRRRPTGKCISIRYHLPVFYPRYAYTPIRAYVRDACARQPVALYVQRANRRELRCV